MFLVTSNNKRFRRKIVVSVNWHSKDSVTYFSNHIKGFQLIKVREEKVVCLAKHEDRLQGNLYAETMTNFIEQDWIDMCFYCIEVTVNDIEAIELPCIAPIDIEQEELVARLTSECKKRIKVEKIAVYAECWLEKNLDTESHDR